MSAYPKIVVLDPTPIGSPTATGQLKSMLFEGWPEDKIMQVAHSGGTELSIQQGIGGKPIYTHDCAAALEACQQFQPDVVYLRLADDATNHFQLSVQILELLQRPVIFHVMDDWHGAKMISGSRSFKLLDTLTRFIISRSSVFLTDGDAYVDDLSRRFGVPFENMLNAIRPEEWPIVRDKREMDQPFLFSHMGNFETDMSRQSVLEIAEAIEVVAQHHPVRFDIHVRDYLVEMAKSLTAHLQHTRIFEQDADIKRYREILCQSNANTYAYNFDPVSEVYIGKGIPNKTCEVLAAQRPILAYGPTSLACIRYLRDHDVATIVSHNTIPSLVEGISSILSGSLDEAARLNRVKDLLATNHDAGVTQTRFRKIVSELAQKPNEIVVVNKPIPKELAADFSAIAMVSDILSDAPGFFVAAGGGVGISSRKLLSNGWRGVIFEPDPSNVSVLTRRLSSFGSRATIVQTALGSTTETGRILYGIEDGGRFSSLLPLDEKYDEIARVEVSTLKDSLVPYSATQIKLLIIDAQGFEAPILDGLDIKKSLPSVIVIKFDNAIQKRWDISCEDLIKKLEDNFYYSAILETFERGGLDMNASLACLWGPDSAPTTNDAHGLIIAFRSEVQFDAFISQINSQPRKSIRETAQMWESSVLEERRLGEVVLEGSIASDNEVIQMVYDSAESSEITSNAPQVLLQNNQPDIALANLAAPVAASQSGLANRMVGAVVAGVKGSIRPLLGRAPRSIGFAAILTVALFACRYFADGQTFGALDLGRDLFGSMAWSGLGITLFATAAQFVSSTYLHLGIQRKGIVFTAFRAVYGLSTLFVRFLFLVYPTTVLATGGMVGAHIMAPNLTAPALLAIIQLGVLAAVAYGFFRARNALRTSQAQSANYIIEAQSSLNEVRSWAIGLAEQQSTLQTVLSETQRALKSELSDKVTQLASRFSLAQEALFREQGERAAVVEAIAEQSLRIGLVETAAQRASEHLRQELLERQSAIQANADALSIEIEEKLGASLQAAQEMLGREQEQRVALAAKIDAIEIAAHAAHAEAALVQANAQKALDSKLASKLSEEASRVSEVIAFGLERVQAQSLEVQAEVADFNAALTLKVDQLLSETENLEAKLLSTEARLSETTAKQLSGLESELKTIENNARKWNETTEASVSEIQNALNQTTSITSMVEALSLQIDEIIVAGVKNDARFEEVRRVVERLNQQIHDDTRFVEIGNDLNELRANMLHEADALSQLQAKISEVDELKSSSDRVNQTVEGQKNLIDQLDRRLESTTRHGFQIVQRWLNDSETASLVEEMNAAFGLNLKESAVEYMAHVTRHVEGASIGRLAALIQTSILRACALKSLPTKNPHILEIGTLFGVGSAVLVETGRPFFDSIAVTVIDPFDGYYGSEQHDILTSLPITSANFLENMARIGMENFRIIQGFSEDPNVIKLASDTRYDYLLIDGDHSYQGVKNDFESYIGFVNERGLVVVDDYGVPEWHEVTRYVDEVMMKSPLIEHVYTGHETAIFRVKPQAVRAQKRTVSELRGPKVASRRRRAISRTKPS